jgi:hypothetical protein
LESEKLYLNLLLLPPDVTFFPGRKKCSPGIGNAYPQRSALSLALVLPAAARRSLLWRDFDATETEFDIRISFCCPVLLCTGLHQR